MDQVPELLQVIIIYFLIAPLKFCVKIHLTIRLFYRFKYFVIHIRISRSANALMSFKNMMRLYRDLNIYVLLALCSIIAPAYTIRNSVQTKKVKTVVIQCYLFIPFPPQSIFTITVYTLSQNIPAIHLILQGLSVKQYLLHRNKI